MAQQRITDLPQITQITDATKLYFGEQIKDYHGTFAQVKTALSYQNILDRLQLIEDNLIGTIQIFAALELTEDYLLCNGGEYLKSDYPKLYGKIGDVFGTGDYTAPSDTDHFRVPDLQGQFIRGTVNGNLGEKQVDMMRKIKGHTNPWFYTESSWSGAFTVSGTANQGGSGNGNFMGTKTMNFDSSKGIEGQEGKVSPNVGSETRPKNISLIFGIKAK